MSQSSNSNSSNSNSQNFDQPEEVDQAFQNLISTVSGIVSSYEKNKSWNGSTTNSLQSKINAEYKFCKDIEALMPKYATELHLPPGLISSSS